MIVYLGLCLLCDVVFEDRFTGTYWETIIRSITFCMALTFVNISEKRGWNSWSRIIEIFKRKK